MQPEDAIGTQVNLNIPVARFHSVLSWDDNTIRRLVNRAVELAVKVGLRLDDDTEGLYLKEAERRGATVDRQLRAVMFTEADILSTVEVMRQTQPAPHPLRDLCRSTKGREEQYDVGNGANLMFDWDAWQVKPPAVSDLVEVCQWAQGCDDVGLLVQPFMLKDIDPNLEPIFSYAVMAKYCRRRLLANQPTEPVHVRYLQKMNRVVENARGYKPVMLDYEYVNPPFRMSLRSIATMLERVDSGACTTMGIGPMSVNGMSAPVTVAGLAVTALAEILAGLTFFRILRPGYGLRANVCTGSLDLRTARVSYFGMHTHLCNLAAWELLVRGLGVDAPCLTWYRDANEPGLQALYEFGMAQAFFSCVLNRCTPEIGGLGNGNIFSPHQAMLDMAAAREFDELACGFTVSDEALALDEVAAGRFEQGVHMATEHTLKHMQDGLPFSNVLFRGLSAGAQHDKGHTQTAELLEKAAAAVHDATAKGRQMKPDLELSNELYGYVKEAARELHIDAPPLP